MLHDLLVVDLSRHLPGPLTTKILRDLGARVLKVEEPTQGDPLRDAPPFLMGASTLASLILGGVESIALDLRQEAARDALLTLLLDADVLVDSFRPGVLDRFGLDDEELRKRFPKLVHCSLTGWGREGPWANRSGHDLTYQAVAGAMAGSPGMPAITVADQVSAWSAATSILAALHRRDGGGGGCRIDQALMDGAAHANMVAWAAEGDGPHTQGERLPLTGRFPCYRIYRTQDDRPLAVACLEPHFWKRFCEVVRRPKLIPLQYDNRLEAHEKVARLVASKTLRRWGQRLNGHDLPIEPVLTPAEAFEHPQMQFRGVVSRQEGRYHLGHPALLDGERPQGKQSMPPLGAQTADLLSEFSLGAPAGSRKASGIGTRRGWNRKVKRWWLERKTRE